MIYLAEQYEPPPVVSGANGGNHVEIYEEIELEDCPYCGGAGLLEEEGGWSWYVMCMDCGSQTASFEFKTRDERKEAAQKAANLWNMGKVVRSDLGE